MSEATTSAASGLAALEARLRQDLAWLELPAKSWIPPKTVDNQPVLDVAVIGGGQAGMAAAVSLLHLGINNTMLIAAVISVVGLMVSVWLAPETRGMSLERAASLAR